MMDTNPQPGRALVAATNDDELIRVLGQSLYPGARPESIRLVLAWCKATGRDPMKKPIHIVRMEVTVAETGKKEYRDVLMPGIGTYRTDAANSGAYAGIDEPEFGPQVSEQIDGMMVTFPEWCRVTVYRMVGGERRAFTAKEYWIENYASGYQGKGVNAMWRKRKYGQLAKVAESQALRKAFPDETGQTYTAEEMEGKSFAGETIDAEPDRRVQQETRREQHRTIKSERYEAPPDDERKPEVSEEAERISAFVAQTDVDLRSTTKGTDAYKVFLRALSLAPTLDDVAALQGHPFRQHVKKSFPPMLQEAVDKAFIEAGLRLAPAADPPADETRGPSWDAPTTGNGNPPAGSGQMAGTGTSGNHGHAAGPEGNGMQDEIERLARHLESEERREAGEGGEEPREWLPGDP